MNMEWVILLELIESLRKPEYSIAYAMFIIANLNSSQKIILDNAFPLVDSFIYLFILKNKESTHMAQ